MMLLMEVEGFFFFFSHIYSRILDIKLYFTVIITNYFSFQVCHHPPMSAGHAENEHFIYDISSKVKTKFLGNSVDVYPLGR
jgi:hypothetical protein